MNKDSTPPARFRFVRGLVWDDELNESVPLDPMCDVVGKKFAGLSVWDPTPKRIIIYRSPEGKIAWKYDAADNHGHH